MKTKQIEFWDGNFGKEYTDRNSFDQKEWDNFYISTWGKTKLEMNQNLIGHLPKDIKILEVGCNIGLQLDGLQRMGFTNLYGIELQQYAVEKAKEYTRNINLIQGSGFDIPFKDNYFDIVCTNGVLIHIAPENYKSIMGEMVRCSKKYVMGFEYFADEVTPISYRGNKNYLWKANFAKLFIEESKNLKLVKEEFYKYLQSENIDCMYLLEKI